MSVRLFVALAFKHTLNHMWKSIMTTFNFLITSSAVLHPTSSGRKGGYVDKTKRRGIGRNKVLKYLILLISFATANADMEGLDIKKNNERPMSLTDSAKQLDEVSRNQLRGNLNPSEAVSQDKDILDSLLGHMQTLQEQVKDGGDGTAVALLLGSVIEDAQSAAELMSGNGNESALERKQLNARELQESIKGMTASQLRAMVDELASKIEEMIRSTQDGLDIVKEAERSITNAAGGIYHRRASASKSNEQSDFKFGYSSSSSDWRAFKAGKFNIPSTPTLSKYGKRDYVKFPKLKMADELRKKNGDHSHGRRLRLQDRQECQPECNIEDLDCNCRRLFKCTQELSSYDFVTLFVGGYIDQDPFSDGFGTFGENSLSNINLFDAMEDGFSNYIQDIQDLAKEDQVNTDNCYAVLEEFYSACRPDEETCSEPNTKSFQLSTEKVCNAVDSRTKLDVTATGDLFDFKNYAVPQPFTGTSESKYLRIELAVVCCKDDIGDVDYDKWYQNKASCPLTSRNTKFMFLAYPSAEEFCNEEEGRLCTKDELERNCGDAWPQGELVWSSTEATDDIVCPAISSDICSEFVVELDKIYGLNNTYEHNRDNLGPKCGEGYELTVAECKEAGKQLNVGQERDFIVGRWSHTPCECFLWGANQLHYNSGTTCTTNTPNNNKGIVCKTNKGNPNPMRVNGLLPIQSDFTNIHFPIDFDRVLSSSGRERIEGYKYYRHRKVFVTSNTYDGNLRENRTDYELLLGEYSRCPSTHFDISSEDECREAGRQLDLGSAFTTGDWSDTPCKCFLWSTGLHWDRGTRCSATDSRNRGVVCKKRTDNLGMLGAHAKCQALANDAGLNGIYKAWISDATNSPSTNFESFNQDTTDIPFRLVDGTIIADNWADLLSGSLKHPIDMNERGRREWPGPTTCVWTNTRTSGTRAITSADCKSWRSSNSGTAAEIGEISATNSLWTGPNINLRAFCSAQCRLYCFQQTPELDIDNSACEAKLGPQSELANACDESMDFLLGNEISTGSLASIAKSAFEVPEEQFTPQWVPWYLSLVDTPTIERNHEFMDYYLNITDPKNEPGWFDWYLSIRDDEGFTLPNPNGGIFFCNDQEILDDPYSSATLRNCQEAWLYNASNPYTSQYEAISYPDDPDFSPYNETSCDAFPTCRLEWLNISSNPFSDDDTFGAVVYNEETIRNVCGVNYNDAASNCNTNEDCPSGFSYECPEGLDCFANVPCPDINKEGCGLFFDYCRQLNPQLNQCQRFWDVCRRDLNESYSYWQYPLPNCTDSDTLPEGDIVTCPSKWLNYTENPYEVKENEACYSFFNTCREEVTTQNLNYTEYPIEFCEGNPSLTCKEDWLEQEVSPYSEESNNPDPACDRFWNHCRDQLITEYPRWYWPLPGIPTSFELLPGYCCLDTPSSNNEKYFGSTYDPGRNMTCQNDGPLHTWLSPEPCSIANGQWFRNPCYTLQRCIANRPTKDDPDFNEQFEDWVLDEDMDIFNPFDQEQCSQTRVALGYEETHLDDGAVCETFNEYKCDPFFDDLSYLVDGADDGPKRFVQVVYTPVEFDPDKPLIFEPLPNNDGWELVDLVTPEESEHIKALKKSQTVLEIASENYKALYDHVHELNKNKCLFIPSWLELVTPVGGISIPNPTYIICQNLNFFQKVLSKIIVTALKASLWAVKQALEILTPDPVEEIDQVLYIESIYENLKSSDKWTYLALETINLNLNDQHFQMRQELQDRHTDIVNYVNQYTNCMSNFLGLQIFIALEADVNPLSELCSSLLGLNPNRRLTEQKENLPFSLDVVFGPNSFPNQVSQVLVKEEQILVDVESIQERANDMYDNQQVMMDTLSDIQKELDIDHKDSKSKKSKKAKGEKAEEAQDEDSDLFDRRLSGIEEMVTKIEEIASGVKEVKTEVKESIDEVKDKVERIEGKVDKVAMIEEKVENMEKSIEDIKEMLSQLIMKG